VAVTSAPRARKNSKAARPDFSIPTTSALIPSIFILFVAQALVPAASALHADACLLP
jgi:hypothetical protein